MWTLRSSLKKFGPQRSGCGPLAEVQRIVRGNLEDTLDISSISCRHYRVIERWILAQRQRRRLSLQPTGYGIRSFAGRYQTAWLLQKSVYLSHLILAGNQAVVKEVSDETGSNLCQGQRR